MNSFPLHAAAAGDESGLEGLICELPTTLDIEALELVIIR
jgi:hypothetical protein